MPLKSTPLEITAASKKVLALNVDFVMSTLYGLDKNSLVCWRDILAYIKKDSHNIKHISWSYQNTPKPYKSRLVKLEALTAKGGMFIIHYYGNLHLSSKYFRKDIL